MMLRYKCLKYIVMNTKTKMLCTSHDRAIPFNYCVVYMSVKNKFITN